MTPTQRRKHEWKDEYTLLCERCGYILEDLDHDLPCPECGKPITESLPERRVGTPWQQKPSFKSLLQTWWMTIRHPLKALELMKLEEGDRFGLLLPTLWVSTGFALLSVCLEGFPNLLSWIIGPIVLTLFALPFMLALFLLSGIEAVGLQFFSRKRKTRVTSSIAWSIVGHGAVGWAMTFFIWSITWKVDWLYKLTHPVDTNWELRQQLMYRTDHILFPGLIAGFVVGFLFFETFAYLGLRRCKYANRTRPNQTPKP